MQPSSTCTKVQLNLRANELTNPPGTTFLHEAAIQCLLLLKNKQALSLFSTKLVLSSSNKHKSQHTLDMLTCSAISLGCHRIGCIGRVIWNHSSCGGVSCIGHHVGVWILRALRMRAALCNRSIRCLLKGGCSRPLATAGMRLPTMHRGSCQYPMSGTAATIRGQHTFNLSLDG